MCSPKIIKGKSYTDQRGILNYNNLFNASAIKRIYIIENSSTKIFRGWQGHKIEQRWFTAISGSFEIQLILIDNWNNPSADLERITFELTNETLDVLHITSGYISSIQSFANNSKLLIMSDYELNEVKDEYRFNPNYFTL